MSNDPDNSASGSPISVLRSTDAAFIATLIQTTAAQDVRELADELSVAGWTAALWDAKRGVRMWCGKTDCVGHQIWIVMQPIAENYVIALRNKLQLKTCWKE